MYNKLLNYAHIIIYQFVHAFSSASPIMRGWGRLACPAFRPECHCIRSWRLCWCFCRWVFHLCSYHSPSKNRGTSGLRAAMHPMQLIDCRAHSQWISWLQWAWGLQWWWRCAENSAWTRKNRTLRCHCPLFNDSNPNIHCIGFLFIYNSNIKHMPYNMLNILHSLSSLLLLL